MKSQSEILSFSLLFLVSIILIFFAFFWGKPILEKNIDGNRIILAEQFIRDLDSKIQVVSKFGGREVIEFNLYGDLELIQNESYNDIIEFRMPITLELPEKWVFLENSTVIIREIKQGDVFKIQLFYSIRSNKKDFVIDLFSDGNTITSGGSIAIEKNETIIEEDIIKTRVKLIIS